MTSSELSATTLNDWIARTIVLAQEAHLEELGQTLQKLPARFADHTVRVGIVGEENRGKSTLINCLLGRKIVPESIVPTVPAITTVIAGAAEHIHVLGPQGITSEHAIDEDAWDELLVSGQEEADTPLQLIQVVVDHPWLATQPFEIIELAAFEHREAAQAALMHQIVQTCDIVFFVISAQMPFNQTERVWIQHYVRERGIDLRFVVTHLDVVPPRQRPDVITRIKQTLQQSFGVQAEDLATSLWFFDAADVAATSDLRMALQQVIEAIAPEEAQARQIRGTLINALETLAQRSQELLTLAQSQESGPAREDSQGRLQWRQVRLDFERRRQRSFDQLRHQADDAALQAQYAIHTAIQETQQLKTWSEQEMPRLLRDRAAQIEATLQSAVQQQYAQDIAALIRAIDAMFSLTLTLSKQSTVQTPLQMDFILKQELGDLQASRVFTWLASGTTAIMTYLLTRERFKGNETTQHPLITNLVRVLPVVELGVGYFGDQMLRQRSQEQKSHLEREVQAVIEERVQRYMQELLAEARQAYDHALDVALALQQEWELRMALVTNKDAHALQQARDLHQQVAHLAAEIRR